jgi:hypothetical protein
MKNDAEMLLILGVCTVVVISIFMCYTPIC